MSTVKQKYLDAYNKAYNSGENAQPTNEVKDYSLHEGYGSLTSDQKNTLQNWYDAYQNEQSIAKAATEQTLQATKTSDLYLKYLNQMNAQHGLSGQGIADTSLNRLQNTYLANLNAINSEKANLTQQNYQNAYNTQRANEEASEQEQKAEQEKHEQELKADQEKHEQKISNAIYNLFNSGATKAQAQEFIENTYPDENDKAIANSYLGQYANWAEESNEDAGSVNDIAEKLKGMTQSEAKEYINDLELSEEEKFELNNYIETNLPEKFGDYGTGGNGGGYMQKVEVTDNGEIILSSLFTSDGKLQSQKNSVSSISIGNEDFEIDFDNTGSIQRVDGDTASQAFGFSIDKVTKKDGQIVAATDGSFWLDTSNGWVKVKKVKK